MPVDAVARSLPAGAGPVPSRAWWKSPVAAAWVLSVGFDLSLHAGLLARGRSWRRRSWSLVAVTVAIRSAGLAPAMRRVR